MSLQLLSARVSRALISSLFIHYKSLKIQLLSLKSLNNQITSCPVSATKMVDNLKNVDYKGLLEAQRDDSVLIIDVREQKEIDETGKLPGSIHIPMGNVSNVLKTLADNEFKKQYDKPKPKKDTKIIVSCRAGIRSAKVQGKLQEMGYENAWNYVGGWGEWETKNKS